IPFPFEHGWFGRRDGGNELRRADRAPYGSIGRITRKSRPEISRQRRQSGRSVREEDLDGQVSRRLDAAGMYLSVNASDAPALGVAVFELAFERGLMNRRCAHL